MRKTEKITRKNKNSNNKYFVVSRNKINFYKTCSIIETKTIFRQISKTSDSHKFQKIQI